MIKRLINSPVASNCYIIYGLSSKECIIVDPGSKNSSELEGFLMEKLLIPVYIIITHYHFDHIWGVQDLVVKFGAKVISSTISSHKVTNGKLNLSSFYEAKGFTIAPADILVEEINYSLLWQNVTFDFFDTKGHSDGCISMLFENNLFTGDALIRDIQIPTKLPGGSKNSLKETYKLFHKLLENKPEGLMVYPGHGEIFRLSVEDLELTD